jgi:hypothetical protein
MKARRKPVQHEKFEQSNGVDLLTKIGAKVYILGTRRPSGKPCPRCGTFVREHQGTCQTPGISDVFAFLPARGPTPCEHCTRDHVCEAHEGQRRRASRLLLVWEAKSQTGKPSEAQKEFLALCAAADVAHVLGDLNQLVGWLIGHGYVKADQIPHHHVPYHLKEAV